jgi:hypothetical protein
MTPFLPLFVVFFCILEKFLQVFGVFEYSSIYGKNTRHIPPHFAVFFRGSGFTLNIYPYEVGGIYSNPLWCSSAKPAPQRLQLLGSARKPQTLPYYFTPPQHPTAFTFLAQEVSKASFSPPAKVSTANPVNTFF